MFSQKTLFSFALAFLCPLILSGTANALDRLDAEYFKSLHGVNISEKGSFGTQKASDKHLAADTDRSEYGFSGLKINITPPAIPAARINSGFHSDQRIDTVMFQANYDFAPTSYGTPYLNAGIGIISRQPDETGPADRLYIGQQTDNDFVLEAGGGLQVPLDEDVSLTGGYRFFNSEDTEFGPAGLEYNSHEFRMGFSFKLPATQ